MTELLLIGSFFLSIVGAFVVLFTIIKSLQDQVSAQDEQLRKIRYGYVNGQQFSDLKEEIRQLENHLGVSVIDYPAGKEVRKVK